MMDASKQRERLRAYQAAARNIELAEAAIGILERVDTFEARTAINTLKRGQNKQLKLLDASAAKLGAPYGA